MSNKLAVIAIGGNALVPDSDHLSLDSQYQKAYEIADHIANMMLEGWNVVVTHGNGPQVGMILRRSEMTRQELPPLPMNYAVAQTQGSLGYMLCNAMREFFANNKINREPVAIVTQTIVDIKDPAFKNPTKPVGDWYSKEIAEKMATQNGWSVVEDSGRGWRRVVPSPMPKEIVEMDIIKTMVGMGLSVVAVGGGGIPVIKEGNKLIGTDAVIDKDLTAAMLGIELKADMLILPTAVEKVAVQFGKPTQKWLDNVSLEDAEKYMAAGEFPAGSMGPKVKAIMQYVKATGGRGVITTVQNMRNAVKGTGGTHFIK